MADSVKPTDLEERFARERFDLRTLEDEVRADRLCHELLHEFRDRMVREAGQDPLTAGELAHGADLFLRDFIIDDRRENIFDPRPGRVRQFGGNWYIVRKAEPDIRELQGILRGVEAFYRWLEALGWISTLQAGQVARECALLEYFAKRIEAFWAIEGNGFAAWEKACTLRD